MVEQRVKREAMVVHSEVVVIGELKLTSSLLSGPRTESVKVLELIVCTFLVFVCDVFRDECGPYVLSSAPSAFSDS